MPSDSAARLPDHPRPQGRYVPAVAEAGLILTAGMTPRVDGVLQYAGQVGGPVTVDDARTAAGIAVANAVAAAAAEAGSLEAIGRVLRMTVYVNAVGGFTEHSRVADGASDRLVELLGERGTVARTAVGVASLPGGACLEIELTCARARP